MLPRGPLWPWRVATAEDNEEEVDWQDEEETVEQRRARDDGGEPRTRHEAEEVVGGVPALGEVGRPLKCAQVAKAHVLGADGALPW